MVGISMFLFPHCFISGCTHGNVGSFSWTNSECQFITSYIFFCWIFLNIFPISHICSLHFSAICKKKFNRSYEIVRFFNSTKTSTQNRYIINFKIKVEILTCLFHRLFTSRKSNQKHLEISLKMFSKFR